MKQEALDTLKASLKYTYPKYYTQSKNEWIYEVCGGDPFQEFIEIPDFELESLDAGLTPGQIDLNNCKIVYEKLSFLTESQASDERLWAGLTHGTFYGYMRKRFGYDKGVVPNSKAAGKIQTQFFYSQGTRAGCFRNRIAKSWWVGKCTYDKNRKNPFEKLDALGSADIVSKVSEIFKSYNFSSNPNILDGIIKCFEHFNKLGIKILPRDHVRPSMQLLNAIGGNIILDALSAEEIADIMINNIVNIRSGNVSKIVFSNIDDTEDDSDDEEIVLGTDLIEIKSKDTIVEVIVETIESNEIEEVAEETHYSQEDDSQVLEDNEEMTVVLGGTAVLSEEETGVTKSFKVDFINGILTEVTSSLLGKSVGDKIKFKDKEYVIQKFYFD